VLALSWDQVDEIRTRIKSLNPYGGKASSKSILELEGENYDRESGERRQLYCYAISSKRYCLYNLDERGLPELRIATELDDHAEREMIERQPTVRKRSDHGLGYLINPLDPDSGARDWILGGWEWIIRGALELDAPEPEWFKRPAMMRSAVTKPRLLAGFEQWNEGKSEREQIRPFNFVMVTGQRPDSGDLTKVVGLMDDPSEVRAPAKIGPLVMPYESNPRKWEKASCAELHEPSNHHRITTRQLYVYDDRDLITVRSLRDVFHEYR
jgi:hypothetical protein